MIFVTVGAQMPFERLVSAVDDWAESRSRDDVFAQIGQTAHLPKRIDWTRSLRPASYREMIKGADLVVAHAGMGTIFSALEAGTPLIVFPRRGDLRETRNDHQLATARLFAGQRKLTSCLTVAELTACLDNIDALMPTDMIGSCADQSLLDTVRQFVDGNGA